MHARAPVAPPDGAWRLYGRGRRAVLVGVLFLVSTCNYLDRHVLGVLLEPIKHEFHASDAQLGLLTGVAFALFYATLGLPIARLADRRDRKRIIAAALLAWSCMTMLCGLAQNFAQLALARVGVGAGEAGAGPAAQSLLADYHRPDDRARALAVFTFSATVGYIVGLAGGGWVAERYGWRAAFMAAGAPGLVLALVALFALEEPRRRAGQAPAPAEGDLWRALRELSRKPTYVAIVGSMVLYFFVAYGALVFTTSFLVRVHHLPLGRAGALYGFVSAGGAAVGTLAGGVLGDRLGRRDLRWLCRLPGWGLVAACPIHAAAFLAPTPGLMMALLFVGASTLSAVVPLQYAALHAVCGSGRRATAVALAFFFANLLGLGLGPPLAGVLSDGLGRTLGAAEGLRAALVAAVAIFVPCGLLMLLAARTLRRDEEA